MLLIDKYMEMGIDFDDLPVVEAGKPQKSLKSSLVSDRQTLAAIDVGSNGIRLAIGVVNDDGRIETAHYERVAVRLGTDAFSLRRLQPETIDQVVETFRAFRKKIDSYAVNAVRAVATSAARESENSDELVDAIQRETEIELEIIGGLEEAQLMFYAIAPRYDLRKKSALLIDMGGGSVEVTVAWDRRAVGAESLPLGPVRLLQELNECGWPEFRAPHLLEKHGFAIESFVGTELQPSINVEMAFGAGGNIDALAELRAPLLGKRKTHKIKVGDLETMIPMLIGMPVKDRITELKLKPDRADVIAIAAMVLHLIMDETNVPRVFVPGLGIKDGMLSQLAASIRR